MQVRDIMTQPVVTCRSTDTLNAAARLMWERDCGAVPVTDDDGLLVGIVTDRDACMAAYTRGEPLGSVPVSVAMAKRVFSCHPDDSLEQAERLMGEKKIRRMPIVDDGGHPIGMLSLNDIARFAASARKTGKVEHAVVGTLAAICEPRSPAKPRSAGVPAAPSPTSSAMPSFGRSRP
jgi:CBS domain-containing protein